MVDFFEFRDGNSQGEAWEDELIFELGYFHFFLIFCYEIFHELFAGIDDFSVGPFVDFFRSHWRGISGIG